LNACLHEAVWPQTFGVLIEQVLLTCTLDRPERQLFRNWGRLVMSGISKRCHELYFIGTRSLQSERLIRVCQNAIRPYRVWGFIDTEVWKNKSTIADSLPAARTTLNPTQRFELYQKLKKIDSEFAPKTSSTPVSFKSQSG
jgi:hypothetical protein